MSFRREPKTNPIAWIVVADRAHARIFRAHWPDLNGFQPVEERFHAEGQMQAREVRDAPKGRERSPDGAKNTYEPATDFRHATAQHFALEIANRLEEGRTNNDFGHVVVAAPALLLGELRQRFSPALAKLVEAEIDKALAHLDQPTILLQARNAVETVAHA